MGLIKIGELEIKFEAPYSVNDYSKEMKEKIIRRVADLWYCKNFFKISFTQIDDTSTIEWMNKNSKRVNFGSIKKGEEKTPNSLYGIQSQIFDAYVENVIINGDFLLQD